MNSDGLTSGAQSTSAAETSVLLSTQPQSVWQQATRRGLLGSLVCVAFLWCLYAWQPDLLAALCVLPVWTWLLVGLTGHLVTIGSRKWRHWKLSAVAWIIFGGVFCDEWPSVVRQLAPTKVPQDNERELAIVSMNCLTGKWQMFPEFIELRPDLILLQESPNQRKLEPLASDLYGDEGAVISSRGCSIVARGELVLDSDHSTPLLTIAYWTPPGGERTLVVSLRLTHSPIRVDLWRGDCWGEHQACRELHREQLAPLLALMKSLPSDLPVIVGGDFNTPARSSIVRPLEESLIDTFSDSGRGWGNTITRDYPFHRIDSIWVSPHFRPLASQTHITPHSDHRMVHSQVAIPRKKQ
ncbi:MAG: endonuclease/exonuclease/phosphatase family protein [Planctomycetaceae bacterium]